MTRRTQTSFPRVLLQKTCSIEFPLLLELLARSTRLFFVRFVVRQKVFVCQNKTILRRFWRIFTTEIIQRFFVGYCRHHKRGRKSATNENVNNNLGRKQGGKQRTPRERWAYDVTTKLSAVQMQAQVERVFGNGGRFLGDFEAEKNNDRRFAACFYQLLVIVLNPIQHSLHKLLRSKSVFFRRRGTLSYCNALNMYCTGEWVC